MAETNGSNHFDVIVLGAGGAGMMCSIHAGRRGRRVLMIDHAKKIGGKILISGGGRCNFTNLGVSSANYVSQNEHFAKSALARYPSSKFIEMVNNHGIAYHERKFGQLFCDISAKEIVEMLETECGWVDAKFQLDTKIDNITKKESEFEIETSKGVFTCESLVVATGGLSIPKIGATGFGYEIAKKFGLKVTALEPALDGFVFKDELEVLCRELAGITIDCIMTCNGKSFHENVLFTHSGMSGPTSLQCSLHWRKGDSIEINLFPELDVFEWFLKQKKRGSKALVKNLLSELVSARFAQSICAKYFPDERPLPQVSEKALEDFCKILHAWKVFPFSTVGYSKAEVTRGGVDTDELSSKTMESKKVSGLYFIGEVVDVTGWLGGYNYQWAWASGAAAGEVV